MPDLLRLFVTLAVALAVTLWTIYSFADCAPDYQGTRRAQVAHEGAPGMWFAMPVARCMLEDLEALPLVRGQVSLLEEKLSIRDDQLGMLREAVELGDRAQERSIEALRGSEQLRLRAEESRDAWYRSPTFLVGVGVVLGAGVTALLFSIGGD